MDPTFKDALLRPLDPRFGRIELSGVVEALMQSDEFVVTFLLENREDLVDLERLERGERPRLATHRRIDDSRTPRSPSERAWFFLDLAKDMLVWAITPSEPALSSQLVARDCILAIDELRERPLRVALVRLLVRVMDLREVEASLATRLLAPLLDGVAPSSQEAAALRQRLADLAHARGEFEERDALDFQTLRIARMRGDDEGYVRECLRLGLRALGGDDVRGASTWSDEVRRHVGAARMDISGELWSLVEYLEALVALAQERFRDAETRFQGAALRVMESPSGPLPGLAVMVAFAICARTRGALAEEMSWLGQALAEGVRTGVPPSGIAYVHERLHRLQPRLATHLAEESVLASPEVSPAALAQHLLDEAIERGDPTAIRAAAARALERADPEDSTLRGRAHEAFAALAERDCHWDAWANASELQLLAVEHSDRGRAESFLTLAEEAEVRGLSDHADRWYRRVLECGERCGHEGVRYSALEALAELCVTRGDRAGAERFSSMADALEEAGAVRPVAHRSTPRDIPGRTLGPTEPGAQARLLGGYRGAQAPVERRRRPTATAFQTTRAALDPGVVRFTPLDRIPALVADIPPRLDDGACLFDSLLERKADPSALDAMSKRMRQDGNKFADVVALAAWVLCEEARGLDALPFDVRYPDRFEFEAFASPAHVEHWIADFKSERPIREGLAAFSLAYVSTQTLETLATIFDRASPGVQRDRVQGVLLYAIGARLYRGEDIDAALERVIDVRGCNTMRALRERDFMGFHFHLLRIIMAALPAPRRGRLLRRMLDRSNPFFARAAALVSADEEPSMIDHLFSFLIANAEGICEVDGEWVAIGVYCLGEAARVHVEEARRVAHPLLRLGLARWPDPPSDAPVSPELWAGVLRALSELVEPEGSLAYLIVESAERADIGVTRVGGRPIGVDELRWPCSPQTLHNDDRMIHLLTLDLEAAPALRAWHPWFSQAAALAIFIADDEPTALPEPRGADVVPLDAAMLAMGDYEGRLPGERCFGHTVRGRYIARTVAVDTKAAHIVELRASPSVDSFRSRSSTDTMDPQDEEVLITDIASAQRLYFEQLLLSHRSELTLALVDADASLEAGVPRLLFTDPATQRPGTLVFRGGRFYVDIAEECS